MSRPITEFIDRMKKANTSELAAQAVDQLLTVKSTDDLLKRLVEIAQSKKFNAETLGFYVFPVLLAKIPKYEDLLPRIADLVRNQRVPVDFSRHCIGLVATFYRRYCDTYPPDFFAFVHDLAVDSAIPPKVRAHVARLLTKVPEKMQRETLQVLVQSADPDLMEAACHTMSRWSNVEMARASNLVDQVIAFADRTPEKALESVNILRTLARSGKPESNAALGKVIAIANSDQDWGRLTACIGRGRTTQQLAAMIRGAIEKMGPQSRMAIHNLIKREPALLELLYTSGHAEALLEVIKTAPTLMGKASLSYLDKILARADDKVAPRARQIKREITTARYNAFLSTDDLRMRKARFSAVPPGRPPGALVRNGTDKRSLYGEYHTGFNMGDALYRHTHIIDPTCHNHWHAAIFQAFEFLHADTTVEGRMRGVHMTGWPGDVKPFAAARNAFTAPQCDVAAEMENLRQNFLDEFMVDDDHPFHGARQTPTMSKVDRLNLLSTSENLVNRGIHYTFVDMLDWNGADWDGSIAAIDNLRCDGVVEYTYEACGKKVCAGKQVANWNIAAAGNQYPDSHEDLHTWGLNPGELCPKVQAGAEGNDTTFVETQPSAPQVREFSIREEAAPLGNFVVIKFNVQSDQYYSVYVRILVGHAGGPFDFATTGDVGPDSGIAGTWMFKEVDEGTNHFAYWQKPGNQANAAPLEFRLVAVDQGGNVSTEYYCRLPES
jgi:hypothetical protein